MPSAHLICFGARDRAGAGLLVRGISYPYPGEIQMGPVESRRCRAFTPNAYDLVSQRLLDGHGATRRQAGRASRRESRGGRRAASQVGVVLRTKGV